jgi:hypothetical protein
LPELWPTAPPPRPELLRQLAGRLGALVPGSRLLAERLLGAESRIDFVTLDPSGRVVLVLIGEEGDDLELVGRGLAQRAWVEPRLCDWLQLAPDLGVRPDARVKVLLVCPSLRPETLAAAGQLDPETLELAVYRCVRDGARIETLVEAVTTTPPETDAPVDEPEPLPVPSFRTGLTDSDLGLSPEEQREFD